MPEAVAVRTEEVAFVQLLPNALPPSSLDLVAGHVLPAWVTMMKLVDRDVKEATAVNALASEVRDGLKLAPLETLLRVRVVARTAIGVVTPFRSPVVELGVGLIMSAPGADHSVLVRPL